MSNKNRVTALVARLLSPQEAAAVSGGAYSQVAGGYCMYSQTSKDEPFKQVCTVRQ
jgi:hypothetical protein